jgi:hypothetical protein
MTSMNISDLQMTMPDRARIFMSALWFWTYVMFYVTKCINIMLRLFITYTPDSLIIFKHSNSKVSVSNNSTLNVLSTKKSDITNKHPTILKAHIHKTTTDEKMVYRKTINENITNKITAILQMKWDPDISNENDELFGGLNMCDILDIYPIASNAVIWIAYLLELDNKILNTSDEKIGKYVKIMLIDLKNNAIFRTSNLQHEIKTVCGEIPF